SIKSSTSMLIDFWRIRVPAHNRFRGIKRFNRFGSFISDRSIGRTETVTLLDVKDIVMPENGDGHFFLQLGIVLSDLLPEDDKRRLFAFPDVSTFFSGLLEGQPIIGTI